jgi:hypothetical protein
LFKFQSNQEWLAKQIPFNMEKWIKFRWTSGWTAKLSVMAGYLTGDSKNTD